MVGFSLKKARTPWKHVPKRNKKRDSQSKLPNVYSAQGNAQSTSGSFGSPSKSSATPTTNMSSKSPSIPVIDKKQSTRVASRMQRRMSVHNPNYQPQTFDYSSNTLPSMPTNGQPGNIPNLQPPAQPGSTMAIPSRSPNRARNANMEPPRRNPRHKVVVLQPNSLKKALMDRNFNAKTFLHTHLNNASTMEIDKFTSNLNELSLDVQDEVKINMARSYTEIMTVNNALNLASSELKDLRGNIDQLKTIFEQFKLMAEKRLENQAQIEYLESHQHNNSQSLGPPLSMNSNSGNLPRDVTSLKILQEKWNQELSDLYKNVEGSQKLINSIPIIKSASSGTSGATDTTDPTYLSTNTTSMNNAPCRHIILQSDDWIEINTNTLKPLQQASLIIFNDILLVATKSRDSSSKLESELIATSCYHLRDVKAQLYKMANNTMVNDDGLSQNSAHVLFNFTPKSHLTNTVTTTIEVIYETKDRKECGKLLNTIRRAKDDLRDIYLAEEEKTKKIQASFNMLKNSNQTPLRPSTDKTTSPVKMNRGSYVLSSPSKTTNLTGSENTDEIADQYILQTIAMSNYKPTDASSVSDHLRKIDDEIEELDIELTRLKFSSAVQKLLTLEKTLAKIADHLDKSQYQHPGSVTDTDLILQKLINMKIEQRRTTISHKLAQSITSATEITSLKTYVFAMIKLDLPETGLDLFLQNRSDFIQELILQIGSFDNPTNYLVQIAIIRFQTIKKTIMTYQSIFQDIQDKFSSILVNWCSNEIDHHFALIEKQFLNEQMLSPESIKASRKQIDDLKNVGMDFVFKLDEFIRSNSEKLR